MSGFAGMAHPLFLFCKQDLKNQSGMNWRISQYFH